MLDDYTKEMLFKYVINEYSNKEQLDIIEHLVLALRNLNATNFDKDSIEKIYYYGLSRIYDEIINLKTDEVSWNARQELKRRGE